MIRELIPAEWVDILLEKVPASVFDDMDAFLTKEYAEHTVYPSQCDIFNAINGLSPEDVHVIILGQDPYHEPGQAHGLSFSVPDGQPLPPSLCNIYKELSDDLGCRPPKSGNLMRWKEQGVLLLNTVLTVRAHQANSHKDKGWEVITAAILEAVLETRQQKVAVLWGSQAMKTFQSVYESHFKKNGADGIHIIRAPHPSPLSAYRGFFGSKPFSETNRWLASMSIPPIQWN